MGRDDYDVWGEFNNLNVFHIVVKRGRQRIVFIQEHSRVVIADQQKHIFLEMYSKNGAEITA